MPSLSSLTGNEGDGNTALSPRLFYAGRIFRLAQRRNVDQIRWGIFFIQIGAHPKEST